MDAPQYVPVNIESIETDVFPDVALYILRGNNHVLYKNHGRDFSVRDSERLKENGVEFLYVSPEDMEIITDYMESNAGRFLKSQKLNNEAKGRMIYLSLIHI